MHICIHYVHMHTEYHQICTSQCALRNCALYICQGMYRVDHTSPTINMYYFFTMRFSLYTSTHQLAVDYGPQAAVCHLPEVQGHQLHELSGSKGYESRITEKTPDWCHQVSLCCTRGVQYIYVCISYAALNVWYMVCMQWC